MAVRSFLVAKLGLYQLQGPNVCIWASSFPCEAKKSGGAWLDMPLVFSVRSWHRGGCFDGCFGAVSWPSSQSVRLEASPEVRLCHPKPWACAVCQSAARLAVPAASLVSTPHVVHVENILVTRVEVAYKSLFLNVVQRSFSSDALLRLALQRSHLRCGF